MRVPAGDLVFEVETTGSPDDPALLLIAGLGGQLVSWEDAWCAGLADLGLFVVRYDARDVGRSTWLDALGVPDIGAAMAAGRRGEPVAAPYTLDDLADDAASILDGLGCERAHVLGSSFGGMVAQAFAIRHAARTLSLISVMSTTSDRSLPPPRPDAVARLTLPPTDDRDELIERAVAGSHVCSGGRFPLDDERTRQGAARAYDRAHHPEGQARQLMASIAAGSRREALGALRCPALVLHGAEDPLVRVECGRDTAEAIPGARLHVIEGMGHELPPGAWPIALDAIARHLRGE